MKQFKSIEKLDTAILYFLELASSISALLLAFGLIASMANVLTNGAILTDNTIMQRIWSITQCVAIDVALPCMIIRTYHYHTEKETVKTWLYGVLSVLLLFTAAIVSNIEAVQQTLNLTLDAAYSRVFIPVEALIWVRSLVIVLLIVAHALQHVQHNKAEEQPEQKPEAPEQPLTITPELVDLISGLLNQMLTQGQTRVIEETPEPAQIAAPQERKRLPQDPPDAPQTVEERVRVYLADHPEAKIREVSEALTLSMSTANKWMKRVQQSAA